MLATMVPALVRIGGINRDLARHHLALDELSNQLERLSLLPLDQLEQQLSELTVDTSVAAQLPSVQLRGQLVPADLGYRLTLQLSWQRASADAPPISLTTWIFPAVAKPNVTKASNSTPDAAEEPAP
jgi:hypothetical protein